MAPSRIKAVFGVAGVVFLSKILGLFREMVIADRFGTSADYDLYLIAIILPALAYGVVNFASFYLFVPYLTRAFENLNDAEQERDPPAPREELVGAEHAVEQGEQRRTEDQPGRDAELRPAAFF